MNDDELAAAERYLGRLERRGRHSQMKQRRPSPKAPPREQTKTPTSTPPATVKPSPPGRPGFSDPETQRKAAASRAASSEERKRREGDAIAEALLGILTKLEQNQTKIPSRQQENVMTEVQPMNATLSQTLRPNLSRHRLYILGEKVVGLSDQSYGLTPTELRTMADAAEKLEALNLGGDQTLVLNIEQLPYQVTFGRDVTGTFGVLAAWLTENG